MQGEMFSVHKSYSLATCIFLGNIKAFIASVLYFVVAKAQVIVE